MGIRAISSDRKGSTIGTPRALDGRVRATIYSSSAPNFRKLVPIVCSLLLAFSLLSQPMSVAAATSISMAWDPNTDYNLAGYNIYRSTQSAVFNSVPLNGTTLLTTTTFSDSSVQVGQTYYYVVKAVSTDGSESGPSNQIQVTVNPATDVTGPTVSITLIPL